jgi:aryl-phospho-beta-D-glucosidase BglC (GH1 family)
MENLVVNGLDVQPMRSIAAKIAELGFNCVRLPYALDTYFIDPIIPENNLAANQDLVGKTAMEIFDTTIQALTDQGLLILLNNHVKKSMQILKEIKTKNLVAKTHNYFAF